MAPQQHPVRFRLSGGQQIQPVAAALHAGAQHPFHSLAARRYLGMGSFPRQHGFYLQRLVHRRRPRPGVALLPFDYGIRRNFIQPDWRIVPYFEARGGVGDINAKEPYGILYAQGQDLTFTLMMGSGARYNFNSKYSISAGMTYMHVSNFYLSEPKYEDFGINVYGPIVGVNMRIGKPKQRE